MPQSASLPASQQEAELGSARTYTVTILGQKFLSVPLIFTLPRKRVPDPKMGGHQVSL